MKTSKILNSSLVELIVLCIFAFFVYNLLQNSTFGGKNKEKYILDL